MTSPDTKEIGLGAVAQKLEETVKRLRDESQARKKEVQSERLERKKIDRQLELTAARMVQLEQERDLLLAQVKELESDLETNGHGGAFAGKQSAELETARSAAERALVARDEAIERQAELQRDNERLEAAVKELTSDLTGLRSGAEQAATGAEDELEALRSLAQSSREQLEQVAARLTQCGFDAETVPEQVEVLLARLTEVEAELNTTRHELTEAAAAAPDPGLAKELESAQAELAELQKAVEENAEETEAEEMAARAAQAEEQQASLESELESLRTAQTALQEKLAEQEKALAAEKERVEDLQLELSAAQERGTDLERQVVASAGGAMAPVEPEVPPAVAEETEEAPEPSKKAKKKGKGKKKKTEKAKEQEAQEAEPPATVSSGDASTPEADSSEASAEISDDGEVALLSADDLAEIPEPRDPDEEIEIDPTVLRDQILGGEGVLDHAVDDGEASASALDEERDGEEAIGMRRQRDSGSQSILLADDEDDDGPATTTVKKASTPKPPPPQVNGSKEVDLSGCLGKDDDPGAEKFAVMVKDGAELVRTPRFGKIDLVNRLDIQVSDWLETASSWDEIQEVSGGKMAEQKLLEVMYLFFQRDLFRLRQ